MAARLTVASLKGILIGVEGPGSDRWAEAEAGAAAPADTENPETDAEAGSG